MPKSGSKRGSEGTELGGFFGGLTNLIEKLNELAEKGEELNELRSFGREGGVQGVYGFTIRSGLGGEQGRGVKVEPFGNVRKDEKTGRATVREVMEPPVDLFEESDHVLVVAEMPGVGPDDVHVELKEDILTIAAERGSKRYRKEVLLPATFSADAMTRTCRNGVLEIKLVR